MQNIIECAAQIMPVHRAFFYSGVACCLLHFRPALLEDVKLNCSCLNMTCGCKSRGFICSCFCLCLHPSWLFPRKEYHQAKTAQSVSTVTNWCTYLLKNTLKSYKILSPRHVSDHTGIHPQGGHHQILAKVFTGSWSESI